MLAEDGANWSTSLLSCGHHRRSMCRQQKQEYEGGPRNPHDAVCDARAMLNCVSAGDDALRLSGVVHACHLHKIHEPPRRIAPQPLVQAPAYQRARKLACRPRLQVVASDVARTCLCHRRYTFDSHHKHGGFAATPFDLKYVWQRSPATSRKPCQAIPPLLCSTAYLKIKRQRLPVLLSAYQGLFVVGPQLCRPAAKLNKL